MDVWQVKQMPKVLTPEEYFKQTGQSAPEPKKKATRAKNGFDFPSPVATPASVQAKQAEPKPVPVPTFVTKTYAPTSAPDRAPQSYMQVDKLVRKPSVTPPAPAAIDPSVSRVMDRETQKQTLYKKAQSMPGMQEAGKVSKAIRDFGELTGQSLRRGLENAGSSLGELYDLILPTELVLGEDNPIDKAFSDLRQINQTAQANFEAKLDTPAKKIYGTLMQGTGDAIPQALMAMATGGGSLAAQGTQKAMTAAQKAAPVLQSAMQKLGTNPSFWYSYARTATGTYNKELEQGATPVQAAASGTLNGLLGAIVEVSGGLEGFDKALPTGKALLKSALEEGQEEVFQYTIENLVNKAVGSNKAAWFSLDPEQDAVINPLEQLKQGLYGAGVGGLLGGGQQLLSKGLDSSIQKKAAQDMPSVTPESLSKGMGSVIREQQAAKQPAKTFVPEAPAQQTQTPAQQMQPAQAARQETVTQAQSTQPTTPEAQRVLDVARKIGVEATFADLPEGVNGRYENGRITISPNAQNPAMQVLKHELTHHLESSGQYETLTKQVDYMLRREGTDLEEFRDGIQQIYGDLGMTMTPEQAEREAVAQFVENTLFADENSIKRLYAENQGLFSRIYQWIKDTLRKLGRGEDAKALVNAERLYANALRTTETPTVNTENTGAPATVPAFSVQGVSQTGQQSIGNEHYMDLIKRYRAIKAGEKPVRDVQVPMQTDDNTKVRRFARTAMESAAIPDAMVGELADEIAAGKFSYTPIGDKAALAYADKVIQYEGYEGALKQWEAVANGKRAAGKNDIALVERLISAAGAEGDTELTMRLIAEASAELTRGGQVAQASRLLKKLTPQGQLYYLQQSVDKINRDLLDRLKAKAPPKVEIDKALAQELLAAQTQEARDAVQGKILQNIADQVPSTWTDKWNAWRYFAMLGNPKTHIRNFLGNAVFVPARAIKNAVAVPLERTFIPQEKRTKALRAGKDLRQFAKDDFDAIRPTITTGGKLNPMTEIDERRRIFKTKWLEWLRQKNMQALEAEDMIFLKGAYVDSFARALKARGLDASQIQGGSKKTAVESARNYALEEALKATYRDASAVAAALNRFKKVNAATAILGEGLMPFTKTPINILKRGVEYSPAGLLKSLSYDLIQVRRGKLTGAQAITHFTEGLTGTGIVVLGAWLASMGLIKGASSDDDRERGMEDVMGEQAYSVPVPDWLKWLVGGDTYPIDWMAPVSLPLFVGVEAYNMMKGESAANSSARIMDAITTVSEPMVNMSMLQGINNTIKAVGYGKNPLTAAATELATGYISQAVPTLAGQIARFADDTRRTTYVDKNSAWPEFLQKAFQRNVQKIPFASQSLPARQDAWGRADVNTDALSRAFQNFISPGYAKKDKSTGVDKELMRLYEQTGDSGVLPPSGTKSLRVDGEVINFSAEQYFQYAKSKGDKARAVLEELIGNKEYDRLSDEDKAEVVRDVYAYAGALAKKEVVPEYALTTAMQKVGRAKEKGISEEDYFLIKHDLNTIGDANEGDGDTALKRQALLDNKDLTPEQKSVLDDLLVGERTNKVDYTSEKTFSLSQSSDTLQKNWAAVETTGVKYDAYLSYADKLAGIAKDNKGNEPAQRQREALLKDKSLTPAQKSALDDAIIGKRERKIDYTNEETFTISQMSDAAQLDWADAKAKGMKVKDFAKYYPIATAKGGKDACVANLVKAGLSRIQAEAFYTLVRKKR